MTIIGPQFSHSQQPEEGSTSSKAKKSRFTEAAEKSLKRSRDSSSEETSETTHSYSISKSVDDTLQKLAHLTRKRSLSSQDLPLIFKLESELREIVELPHFAGKERYQKIYEETALPLLQKAKLFIRNHPMHFSVKASAEKGKAFTVGFETLKGISNIRKLQANVQSAQEVFLFPKKGSVLKRMNAKAKEESFQVESLLNIMSEGSVIGTFEFRSKHIDAKPFVNMVLLRDLAEKPTAQEKIFERLSKESEYIGCLTGELQLLDLHNANLAVRPDISEEVKRYTDFVVDGKKSSLNKLIVDYLNDEIDPMTSISYKKNGARYECSFSKLPNDLRMAFDSPWSFVVFDTDRALGENNSLQYQIVAGKKSHLVPLRSCLLESEIKDKPLSDETISRLLNSRDEEANAWASGKDAPIYKHLKAEAIAYVQNFVQEKLKKYALSEVGKTHPDITMNRIRARFMHDITRPTEENIQFWKFIKDNSSLQGDVESFSMQRRLAYQLFPPLTLQQQQALIERQDARKSYLEGYQKLESSKRANIGELEEFIQSNPTLFSTPKRKELLHEIERIKQFSDKTTVGWIESYFRGSRYEQIVRLKEKILNESRPTYFNLMKVMYPLLADVYELALHIPGEENPGSLIGYFDYPIERIIEKIREKAHPSSPMGRLATHVEKEMAAVTNPSFFGIFKK